MNIFKTIKILLKLFRYDVPFLLVTGLLFWMPDNRFTVRLRGACVKPFIRKCGRGFRLASTAKIINTDRLQIGDYVGIGRGVWLNCYGGMIIGDDVIIGPYTCISTLIHGFKNGTTRGAASKAAAVCIGKGSWLASLVSVKAGVKIGKGVLVAANAAVVKDVPDNVIVGGVPAKVIKEREDTDYDAQGRWFDNEPDLSSLLGNDEIQS